MRSNSEVTCPVCGQRRGRLIRLLPSSWDYLLLDHARRQNPDWKPEDGICTHCLDQFQSHYIASAGRWFRGNGSPSEINGYQVLPIPMRLLAHPDFSGRGVTLCFIDSSFFPHPDLVYPRSRIKRMLDIVSPKGQSNGFSRVYPESWHGTMTSVVAAGSGYLSGGQYRGIAHHADLILLKVYDEREEGIFRRHIVAALRWVLDHYRRYRIRVVNLSVSGDWPLPIADSPINQTVEELTAAGVVVVAAVGNNPDMPVVPPASAPSAITVGGLDDRNTLDPVADLLYPSTYGLTADALWKPELIAPSIWLPGPILPGTPQQEEAAALFMIWGADDWYLKTELARNLNYTSLDPSLLDQDSADIRAAVAGAIRRECYISPHYKQVDGTSFAAPIVSSVIAQMLEANPRLSVASVRELLLSTARPLPNVPQSQQGYGVIQPLRVVNQAAGKKRFHLPPINPIINYQTHTLTFHYQDNQADSVAVTGDFNDWLSEGAPFEEVDSGKWTVSLPLPPPGIYRYKFIIDGKHWRPDPRNPHREPDEYQGFNSKFVVEENIS